MLLYDLIRDMLEAFNNKSAASDEINNTNNHSRSSYKKQGKLFN